jgi:hypothetical protein
MKVERILIEEAEGNTEKSDLVDWFLAIDVCLA